VNPIFKRKLDDAKHKANLDVIHKLQHRFIRDPYYVNCGRYDGYWAAQCKVCGDPEHGTALHVRP